MALQLSTTVRNAQLDTWETTISTSPQLRIYTGSPPADCATAASGTLLATITLPSDWMAAASGGSKAKSGTWSVAAGASGTAGYYRIYDSTGTTCHEQGTVSLSVAIATSALTAANGNVLTFASTTGVSVGMNVSGTGVVAGSTVVALTGTTVTLSLTSTAGVSSATSITFGGEATLDNTSIASSQTVTITTFTRTIPNA
jgi:hypothetical protein